MPMSAAATTQPSPVNLDPRTALVYAMVMAARSDGPIVPAEAFRMADLVRKLPLFDGFQGHDLGRTVVACANEMDDAGGPRRVLDRISDGLPEHFGLAAYILALDVANADGVRQPEEAEALGHLRRALRIDASAALAVEHAAAADLG